MGLSNSKGNELMKKVFGFVSFLLLLLSACSFGYGTTVPEKQFVYIQQDIIQSVCIEVEVEGEEICLPGRKGKGYASGVLVDHKKDRSYYLTAGHVCIDYKKKKTKESVKIKTKRAIILSNYKDEKLKAKIEAAHMSPDLCLLSTKRVKLAPMKVQKSFHKHQEVLNVAAPAGIWSHKMMINYKGFYNGKIRRENGSVHSVFSLTAQPGSSGSPIINPKNGKLVGIVSSVLLPSYHIVFGPTLEQINDFLDENLYEKD